MADLSGDNLLPALLSEREHLQTLLADAERRLKEINNELKERVAAGETASLPGWLLSHVVFQRRQYTVEAQDIHMLKAKRTAEE